MEFLFQCSTRYLASERSEPVRYPVEQENRNSISPSNHLLFCILYKHLINEKKPTLLPSIHGTKQMEAQESTTGYSGAVA